MKKNQITAPPALASESEAQSISAIMFEPGELEPLVTLRKIALYWMERLASFNPYLIGAVLEGTVTYDSDISLQIFCDDTKELAIFLLDAGIQYDVSETQPTRLSPASKYGSETLSFLWPHANHPEVVGIHLEVYDLDELRRLPRTDAQGKSLRMNRHKVAALIESNGGCTAGFVSGLSD